MVEGAVRLADFRPGFGGRAGWCQHHSTNATNVPERTAAGGRSSSAQNLSGAGGGPQAPVPRLSGPFRLWE
ncbi:hypothetical protein GCM10010255_81480 [Streptomyces coeruleofuscus]|uniref:Uncharacterized protein n=1 Tax=Streptomyces coeruleofuscus TaxID=66879 RepID=A0ABN3JC55_9ACTN